MKITVISALFTVSVIPLAMAQNPRVPPPPPPTAPVLFPLRDTKGAVRFSIHEDGSFSAKGVATVAGVKSIGQVDATNVVCTGSVESSVMSVAKELKIGSVDVGKALESSKVQLERVSTELKGTLDAALGKLTKAAEEKKKADEVVLQAMKDETTANLKQLRTDIAEKLANESASQAKREKARLEAEAAAKKAQAEADAAEKKAAAAEKAAAAKEAAAKEKFEKEQRAKEKAEAEAESAATKAAHAKEMKELRESLEKQMQTMRQEFNAKLNAHQATIDMLVTIVSKFDVSQQLTKLHAAHKAKAGPGVPPPPPPK